MEQLKGLKFTNQTGPAKAAKPASKWYDGINIGDILNKGADIYSSTIKSQTDAENAAEAYAVPIAITGAVVIGGIVAYFYFKKKA